MVRKYIKTIKPYRYHRKGVDKVIFVPKHTRTYRRKRRESSTVVIDTQKVEREYVAAAKRNGFNPLFLREIVLLWYRGYNRSEIAKRLGLSRNTVSKYLERLGRMGERERAELLAYLLASTDVGKKVFEKILSSKTRR